MVHPGLVDTIDCDFLIVGAGSSGCVLASRLVRKGLKVLVVEKGPADTSNLVRRPAQWLAEASSGNAVSEVFMTVPQAGLGNRRLHAFRGRGGGGSSIINATLYNRGRQQDYEGHWPWEVKDIETSFRSIEAELTLEDHNSRSTIGPSFDCMLQEAGLERQSPVENGDQSEEPTWTKEGIGGPMKRTTTKGGQRQTAWAAFVSPVLTLPNLRVKGDVTVSRVIIEGGRAVGIETIEAVPLWKGGGRRVRQLRLAKAAAEIVLCCGSFRTPKLLMLSGIGPRKHLEETGVSVIVDSPQVGANLQDHLVVVASNFSKKPLEDTDFSEDSLHSQTRFSCEHLARPTPVVSPGSGADSDAKAGDSSHAPATGVSNVSTINPPPAAVVGYVCLDGGLLAAQLDVFVSLLLTKPGLLMAAVRIVVTALCWILARIPPIRSSFRCTRGAILFVTTVKSRGTVRLSSADAAAPPLIDPNYLSHSDDEKAFLACWRQFQHATRETPTGKACLGRELVPGAMYNYGDTDENLLRCTRDCAMSFFHPVGTCRMGEAVEDSVVSKDSLRVHGVSGLRVADASVAPRIPSTPTQAMAMMIGDRAAALALKDRFTKDAVQERWVEAASRSIN